jgi:uncharacterized damage-inducible protein DinB
LSNEDVQRVVQFTTSHGEPCSAPLWQLMVNVVDHGTHHRSEATAILGKLGCSPGKLDLLVFLYS